MHTKIDKNGVSVKCVVCSSDNTNAWGGVGSEVYYRCDDCHHDFCVEILGGWFKYRIRAEL